MRITILNNLSYQIFPIIDDMLEFPEEDLKQIGITKQFKDNKIVDYVNVEAKKKELKQELAGFDYIGVKIATGVATKEEYANEIAHCEELRKQIRVLENN